MEQRSGHFTENSTGKLATVNGANGIYGIWTSSAPAGGES